MVIVPSFLAEKGNHIPPRGVATWLMPSEVLMVAKVTSNVVAGVNAKETNG